MASEVEICNNALIALGEATILSLDDESEEARQCKHVYPQMRDVLLRGFPWVFAGHRAELAADPVPPLFGDFSNRFRRPTDCMYIREVWGRFPYRVEGHWILANVDVLQIRYTKRETDPNEMDAMFRNALSYKIAAKLAKSLTDSTDTRQAMLDDYDDAIMEARSVGSMEDYPESLIADDLLEARF